MKHQTTTFTRDNNAAPLRTRHNIRERRQRNHNTHRVRMMKIVCAEKETEDESEKLR